MEISRSQQLAIRHFTGPAMVLAGPGSGKTTVITHRVRHLIRHCKVKPEKILVITFTRAAAAQMRTRFVCLEDCDEEAARHVTFGTFHAVFFNILKLELGYSARSINAGEEGISYDDILLQTDRLFKDQRDVLARWQDKYEFILVDEFQDINDLQYDVISMLSGRHRNLFAVGDDDQSIYAFRGSSVKFMLEFEKRWPGAKIFHLDDNYRSRPGIVEAASAVIEANKRRYKKDLRSIRGADEQESVSMTQFRDVKEECGYLIRSLRQRAIAPGSLDKAAVLTRTVSGGRYLGMQLIDAGIPVKFSYEVPDIRGHWIAQDILSYIRLGMGGRRREDFLRIMNRPCRDLTRKLLRTPVISFDTLRNDCRQNPSALRRLDRLEADLSMIGLMKPYAAVNYIRFGAGYGKYLKEHAQQLCDETQELEETAELLQELSADFETLGEWAMYLEGSRELKEGAEAYGGRSGKSINRDGVRFMTLHSAKGLEFDEVFLPDLDEGMLPYRRHKDSEVNVEEERRLLYVGMTRAKNRLHLMWTKNRFGKECRVSSFLEPLLKKK